ncbi:hypothetical protein [Candidatus Methylomirabilis sp.]|uniref:Uncharacterized protein n=1 Tax=Candidatus Methylomirabilis tolerans TaxID=3123416 RepID=A0AAJ1AG14_9BACT|nr:hypothetical protein [Candidatus Methylomirabilis sp.]
MGRGSGSIVPTIALITVICLLWVYPFCLFHQASAAAYQRDPSSDLDHGSSPPALCDDSHLYAASNSQVAGADTKAGISLRIEPLRAIPRERFSAVRRHELTDLLLPASRSTSKALRMLYVVYQI